jgi:Na+/H+ antiporter NhaC
MKIFKSKKGYSLSDLPSVAMTFLLIGVFFAIALVVLASLGNNASLGANTAGTANYAVQKTITAVSEVPNNWLLLIAVIVAAAVIVGVVMSSFRQ